LTRGIADYKNDIVFIVLKAASKTKELFTDALSQSVRFGRK